MGQRRWRSGHVGRVRRGVVGTKTKAPDRFMFATASGRIWLRWVPLRTLGNLAAWSRDIQVKSHRKVNQVTESQEKSPYGAARESTEGNYDMDLVAIQIGVTGVLLIAHFSRMVWDRIFRSA